MKCPICGDELKLSKKNPAYVLCYSCRKKFRIPESMQSAASQAEDSAAGSAPSVQDEEMTEQTQVFSRREVRDALRKANASRKAEKEAKRAAASKSEADADTDYHFRYANIPPKAVREKQEREMRKAYDELLSIGQEERASKKRGLFGRKK